MDQLPTLEILEQAHQFPGAFTFKAIGRSDDQFAERVVAAIREVLSIEFDPPHSIRTTPGGRHVSVTIDPIVNKAEDVISVYARIRQVEGVVSVF